MCDERFWFEEGGSCGIEERLEKVQHVLKYSSISMSTRTIMRG